MAEEGYTPRGEKFIPFPLGIDAYTAGRNMIQATARLESTYPEWNDKRLTRLKREQNSMFYEFRGEFKQVIKLTDAHLRNFCLDKLEDADVRMMDAAKKLIEEPYGTYEIRQLTDYASAWWDLLIKTKTFVFAQGTMAENNQSSFRRY